MDLGAGGFPFLKAYLLGGFLWMLFPAPLPPPRPWSLCTFFPCAVHLPTTPSSQRTTRTRGKKMQRGDIRQSYFRFSPTSLYTLLISVPLCPLVSVCFFLLTHVHSLFFSSSVSSLWVVSLILLLSNISQRKYQQLHLNYPWY